MEETKKTGFFKRIKISVFDLEKYDVFLNEKVTNAFSYLLKLLLILVIILAVFISIQITKQVDSILNYVEKEFPKFEYKDGALKVSEIVKAYDKEYDARLIVDTGEVTEERLEEYKYDVQEHGCSVIMLKDKALVRVNDIAVNLSYTDMFDIIGISSMNKDNIVNKYNSNGFLFQVGAGLFIYIFIILYADYFIVILENVLIVAVFGWIASKIIGASLKFSKAFSFAIYVLTLSNIINVIYSVVSSFTGFKIKYFSLMYLIIAYIYMMSVILIHKVDIVNEYNKETLNNNDKINDNIENENAKNEKHSTTDKNKNDVEEANENLKSKVNKEKDNKDIKNEDNKD